jgi:hypothetical protein
VALRFNVEVMLAEPGGELLVVLEQLVNGVHGAAP